MEVTDTVVRKCKNVAIFIDKKMRECRIEHDKYIIMLDENTPFSGDEPVKIIHEANFEQIQNMVKTLKIERDSLREQSIELRTTVEVQKKLIDKIEKVETGNRDNSIGLFKSLF